MSQNWGANLVEPHRPLLRTLAFTKFGFEWEGRKALEVVYRGVILSRLQGMRAEAGRWVGILLQSSRQKLKWLGSG